MTDREPPSVQEGSRTETGARETKRPLDRRVWIIVGVAALLILGALVAASVLSGNDDEGDGAQAIPAGTALPGTAEVQELFAGIPQEGPVLGDPDAPVTVAVYSDPQCPACASFAGRTLPDLIERYVRPGDVRIVYRGVPIIGPDSEGGLAATYAAGLQDKLWEFSELTYVNQGAENAGWLDEDFIRTAAGSFPGLDVEQLLEDRDSDAVRAQLAEDVSEAQRIGLEGTPTFQVGRTGERLGDAVLGADLESLSRLIDPLLE
jgi:protein-disulfide isomerase